MSCVFLTIAGHQVSGLGFTTATSLRSPSEERPVGHVFISYSHEDTPYVARLAERIRERGIEVWMDDEIDYGTLYPRVIEEHLEGCAAVVLVMSEHARASEWVSNELEYAKDRDKPVVPLLLSGGRWLEMMTTQHVDVADGGLPPADFYSRLMQVAGLQPEGQAQRVKSPTAWHNPLTVYISSRMSETRDERAAVHNAFESSDLPVLTWDDEFDAGASWRSPFDVWREQIEQTDIYLGIFVQDLGEYTRDGFELARDAGKPTLLFVARHVDDRSDELSEFIHNVDDPMSGIGIGLFEGPEDLAEQVRSSVGYELLRGYREAKRNRGTFVPTRAPGGPLT